ncbi:MAG: hypothetical protein AABW54_02480 [Candidatus Micrarchaeota archaeon]
MSTLEDIGKTVIKNLAASLRKFTAFMFIIYTIGVIVGMHVGANAPQYANIAVLAPIGLAALAYVSTAFAIAIFIVVALLLFLL